MLNAQQFRAAVEQHAPGERRPAAEREHRLVRRHRPDRLRPGAQRRRLGRRLQRWTTACRSTSSTRTASSTANNARRIGLGANYNQRLANDRLIFASPEGHHGRRPVHPAGSAVERRAVRPDPADHRLSAPRPGSTTGPAAPPQPTIRSPSWTSPRRSPQPIGASATCRPSTACPGSRDFAPTLTLGFDVTNGRRINFTPSTLHREVVTGSGGRRPATTRTRSTSCSRPTSTTPRPKPARPRHARPHRRLFVLQDYMDSVYYEGRGLSPTCSATKIVPAAKIRNVSVRAAEQADLLLRPGQLQHQRQVHHGRERPARRLVPLRVSRTTTAPFLPSPRRGGLSQEPFLRGE